MQPASSFSSDYDSAKRFADRFPTGEIIAIKVPRERIFSTAITGCGCLLESEVVVLGGNIEGYVGPSIAKDEMIQQIEKDR